MCKLYNRKIQFVKNAQKICVDLVTFHKPNVVFYKCAKGRGKKLGQLPKGNYSKKNVSCETMEGKNEKTNIKKIL